jgi:hypothetical protein
MSTKLFDITKQLDKFLSSPSNSASLKETNGISGMSIIESHVQKRWLDSENFAVTLNYDSNANDKTNCINIVNVGVAEKNRRKGLFTDFLELLEEFNYGLYFKECPSFYIRIDKVMNPVLDGFLLKKGYIRTKAENETHFSYFKVVQSINSSGHMHTWEETRKPVFESFVS